MSTPKSIVKVIHTFNGSFYDVTFRFDDIPLDAYPYQLSEEQMKRDISFSYPIKLTQETLFPLRVFGKVYITLRKTENDLWKGTVFKYRNDNKNNKESLDNEVDVHVVFKKDGYTRTYYPDGGFDVTNETASTPKTISKRLWEEHVDSWYETAKDNSETPTLKKHLRCVIEEDENRHYNVNFILGDYTSAEHNIYFDDVHRIWELYVNLEGNEGRAYLYRKIGSNEFKLALSRDFSERYYATVEYNTLDRDVKPERDQSQPTTEKHEVTLVYNAVYDYYRLFIDGNRVDRIVDDLSEGYTYWKLKGCIGNESFVKFGIRRLDNVNEWAAFIVREDFGDNVEWVLLPNVKVWFVKDEMRYPDVVNERDKEPVETILISLRYFEGCERGVQVPSYRLVINGNQTCKMVSEKDLKDKVILRWSLDNIGNNIFRVFNAGRGVYKRFGIRKVGNKWEAILLPTGGDWDSNSDWILVENAKVVFVKEDGSVVDCPFTNEPPKPQTPENQPLWVHKRFGELSIGDQFVFAGKELVKLDDYNATTTVKRGKQAFQFQKRDLVKVLQGTLNVIKQSNKAGNTQEDLLLKIKRFVRGELTDD